MKTKRRFSDIVSHQLPANIVFMAFLRESKTVLHSGFHVVDSGFQVLDSGLVVSGTWIPDSSR